MILLKCSSLERTLRTLLAASLLSEGIILFYCICKIKFVFKSLTDRQNEKLGWKLMEEECRNNFQSVNPF